MWTEKLRDIAEKHWRVILITSAVGLSFSALYLLSRPPSKPKSPKTSSQSTSSPTATSSTTSNPNTLADSSPTEPLSPVLEGERLFATSADATSQKNNVAKQEAELDEQNENDQEDIDISTLSESERDELALAAKNRGNKYFSAKKYEKAISLYSKAIALYPVLDKKTAVFYSNRAACYTNLNEFDRVIEDCSTALQIDPLYPRAFVRRANAYEKKLMFAEALEDLTTACILEEFKVQATLIAADRVLRSLAQKRARDVYDNMNREDLPSLSFVTAYLSSFRFDYLPVDLDESSLVAGSGDELYVRAAKAFGKKDWEKAAKLADSAIQASPQKYLALALNLRGTFLFLKGLADAALEDFEESRRLEPSVNTLIKIASVSMEKYLEAGVPEAKGWFEEALKLNSSDPDVYYHRGQVHFLAQEYQEAYEDYKKSLELDDTFVLAKIQLAIVKYRLGDVKESMKLFETARRQHSKVSDVYYYNGEILLDQRKIDEALALFDKAIELNPSSPLAYLNKGIIYFHMKQDFDRAIEYTQKAISVDPRCDLAYSHLAQMFMQQGRLDESIITFKRAVDLARTLADVESAIMGLEAVRAQSLAFKRIKQN